MIKWHVLLYYRRWDAWSCLVWWKVYLKICCSFLGPGSADLTDALHHTQTRCLHDFTNAIYNDDSQLYHMGSDTPLFFWWHWWQPANRHNTFNAWNCTRHWKFGADLCHFFVQLQRSFLTHHMIIYTLSFIHDDCGTAPHSVKVSLLVSLSGEEIKCCW